MSERNPCIILCHFGKEGQCGQVKCVFSPNTRVEMKEQICSSLNIMTKALSDTYLGLPSTMGLDRTDCFQFLIERVVKRISGWKEKLLSTGGKEILLKAVIQAIPTYAMSVFKIPLKIVKESSTR